MKSAVVLLSGGVDSATTMALARRDGFALCALTVSYGQRHRVELDAAGRVARFFDALEHRILSINLDDLGGSALTDDIDVPKDRSESRMRQGIPVTYVPARNTIFLACALGYAEVIGANDIYLGVNAVDYSGYPDCRPPFLDAFSKMAALATKAGVEGRPIEIHAPLIEWSKEKILRTGLELGVDYALTHSCYDPDDQGVACGRCDSCRIRRAAFEKIGQSDPIPYAI